MLDTQLTAVGQQGEKEQALFRDPFSLKTSTATKASSVTEAAASEADVGKAQNCLNSE